MTVCGKISALRLCINTEMWSISGRLVGIAGWDFYRFEKTPVSGTCDEDEG
jgi:hypothetical protein